MNLAGLLIAAQTIREPIPQPVSPAVRTEIIEAGNALFPRPAHSDTLNGGCNEWDTESPELATDGAPCERIVDNFNRHGDAVVTADDLAPATCDSGTGFYMVVSVYRARQLQGLNPGLVCTPGERYGVTGA